MKNRKANAAAAIRKAVAQQLFTSSSILIVN
jgi:hypothetical protein